MTDYNKLVKALRCKRDDCEGCDLAFFDKDEGWMCQYAAKDDDAADAIEALETEVKEAFNRGYNAGYVAGVDNCTSKLKKELDKAKMEMQE